MTNDEQPATFAELSGGRLGTRGCHRCGEPATHSLMLRVVAIGQAQGGNETTASHKTQLCEACAVQLFAATRKAMR
jgi:hypothetical protein